MVYFNFALSYFVPALLGILATWFCRKDLTHPSVKSGIFLLLQIVLVHYFSGTLYAGQIVVILTLGGYFIFNQFANESRKRLDHYVALLCFALYILYWAVEKYLLPLGLIGYPQETIAAGINLIGRIFPHAVASVTDLAANIQSRITDTTWGMIGISYIGFKAIHFFIDYRSGDIKNAKPMEFLSWLLFFPSIVAGPMIRFQDWQEQREQNLVNLATITEGMHRVLVGLFMKIVIADSIHGLTIAGMTEGALSLASFWQIAAACCLYTIYIYFDFAGYSHIAIGLGRFWGITLPENFNAPYRARNLAEFWNRWHISLSLILRDYLYYPISLSMKRIKWLKKFPAISAAVPPLVTFIIAGIWHGAGISFVIFGLLHGIGLAWIAVSKGFKTSGVFFDWWKNSRIAYICSTLITYFYVSFAFLFFTLSSDKLKLVWNNLAEISTNFPS